MVIFTAATAAVVSRADRNGYGSMTGTVRFAMKCPFAIVKSQFASGEPEEIGIAVGISDDVGIRIGPA